jgi:rRNA maturation RNase YbeY
LPYLGEIYISLEQARRQAREYKVTLKEELLRLATHGTLHLLGYDHKKKNQAKIMKAKEEKYLYEK